MSYKSNKVIKGIALLIAVILQFINLSSIGINSRNFSVFIILAVAIWSFIE